MDPKTSCSRISRTKSQGRFNARRRSQTMDKVPKGVTYKRLPTEVTCKRPLIKSFKINRSDVQEAPDKGYRGIDPPDSLIGRDYRSYDPSDSLIGRDQRRS